MFLNARTIRLISEVGLLPDYVAPFRYCRGLLPVDVTDAPALSVEGPRSVPSRILVVLVDGTMAGDTPGRNVRTRIGDRDAGLPRAGETLSSPDVAGRSLPVVPAGGAAKPAGSDGPVVVGGPVGPCGTLSPLFHEVLGPLEHSVLDHAGPAGRHVAMGPVGPYDMLQVLNPLEHSVLDHAGQRAAVGPVGLFGTLYMSPSDCHPAGPAGPYVAGALLAQMKSFKFWIR